MDAPDSLARWLTAHALPTLTREQEGRLCRQLPQSRDLLLRHNLRLIASLAAGWARSGKLSFEDLLQEGAIGFLNALERFDPDRGCKLSTYVVPWIWQAMQRANESMGHTVRIPAHIQERARMARKRREQGAKPPPPYRYPAQKLAFQVLLSGNLCSSLDQQQRSPRNQEAGASRYELGFFGCQQPAQVESRMAWEEMMQALCQSLPARDLDVLLRRAAGEALATIAQDYGLTRERIRQLEKQAKVQAQRLLRSLGWGDHQSSERIEPC